MLALVGVAVALTFRDYGLGWDDYTHSQYGALLLKLYGSGFADREALSFVNLYEYGGGFDMLSALAAKVLPFDLFETRRLCGGIVGMIGLAATWRAARHLGGPPAGLLAVALLATCPLYGGHMMINAKDAPFAAAMALLTLGAVRAFRDDPAPSPATVVICGLGLGLSVGTRVLGGLFAGPALAALAFMMAADARAAGAGASLRRAGAFVLALLPGLVLAYAVMALVWPWGALSPLNPLRAAVYFSDFFEKPWREMFAGRPILVPDMPRIYVPQLMLLKLPELFLLLGLGGVVGAFIAATRRSIAAGQRAALLLVALAAIVPVLLTLVTRPAMYNGIRHFVFLTPPLAMLGGWAGARLLQRLRAWRPGAAVAAAAVMLGGLLAPAIDMVRLHPYEYTYFNRASGGVAAAAPGYMLDYWGLSLKQASAALLAAIAARHEEPANGHWTVAVCGPHPPAKIALGPQFDITWDPKGADFVIALGVYYCTRLDAPVVANIVREGVSYARVYDVRGRSFTNLLTIPPP